MCMLLLIAEWCVEVPNANAKMKILLENRSSLIRRIHISMHVARAYNACRRRRDSSKMRTRKMHLKYNCDKNNKNMEKKEPKEHSHLDTIGLRSNRAMCIPNPTERDLENTVFSR